MKKQVENMEKSFILLVLIVCLVGMNGVVIALTITEDNTVIENTIVNEDLILDGASNCTIRNNTIHGELRLLNESNYNSITNNTVDD